MPASRAATISFRVGVVALTLSGYSGIGAKAAEPDSKVLRGRATIGDWTTDAPGVRRKITVEDLSAPSSSILAINPPRVISRPKGAQLQAPASGGPVTASNVSVESPPGSA